MLLLYDGNGENRVKRMLKNILPIIVILIVIVFFACSKVNFHMDEFYSYTFANGDRFLYENIEEVTDENGTYYHLTKDIIKDALTVEGKEETFQFKKIIDNCSKDIHPPLFYVLLNIVSSIFSVGVFSKWPGLIMNIVLYLLTLFLLYKTVDKLLNRSTIALSVVILYGISPIGLSSMLMIRDYCLLSLLAVIFIYLIIIHNRNDKLYVYIFIILTTALGMLTHYYFAPFAIIISLAYLIYLIVNKQYKKALLYLISIILGLELSFLIFPSSRNAIFATGKFNGGGSLSRIINIKGYVETIGQYFTIKQFLVSVVSIAIISLLLIVLINVKTKKTAKTKMDENIKLGFVLIFADIVALIVIIIISPYAADRYTYLVFPLLYTVVGLLLYRFDGFSDLKIIIGSIMISLLCIMLARPGYLYIQEKEYHQTINKNNDSMCMYLGAFKHNNESIMICDALDYMSFDEVLLAQRIGDESFDSIIKKLENVNRLVLFCGINPDIVENRNLNSLFYGENEVKTIMNRLNMKKYKCIHDGDYSTTYLIER